MMHIWPAFKKACVFISDVLVQTARFVLISCNIIKILLFFVVFVVVVPLFLQTRCKVFTCFIFYKHNCKFAKSELLTLRFL